MRISKKATDAQAKVVIISKIKQCVNVTQTDRNTHTKAEEEAAAAAAKNKAEKEALAKRKSEERRNTEEVVLKQKASWQAAMALERPKLLPSSAC